MRTWTAGLAGLGLLAATACAGGDTDSDTDGDDLDTADTASDPCDEVTIFVDGPEEPQVDDVWTLLLRCDGTTVQGPMVLRVQPDELGFLEENTVRFLQVGEGTIRVQVGSLRAERDVTVRR